MPQTTAHTNTIRRSLILASSSPYRKTLLQRLGLPFRTISPAIDETPRPEETPHQLVARLGLEKARAVARFHSGAIVIGSDQVAVHRGTVLGKAGSPSAARTQLQSLAGQSVTFLTSMCVLSNGASHQIFQHIDTTQVSFRTLTPAEIKNYVDKDQSWDCAGSFKVESLGICLFERIDSQDPTALQGLPMIALCHFLRQLGLDPLMT